MTDALGARSDVIAWSDVWDDLAATLHDYRQQRLGHLLTEDVARFATIRALVARGVDPARLRVEWAHPALRGGKLDLAVDAGPDGAHAIIELKYPREPVATNAAWTMTYGEILKDFYRVAAIPGVEARWCVLVCTDRLAQYLRGAGLNYAVDVFADEFQLDADAAHGLPKTSRDVLGGWTDATASVRTEQVVEVDAGLRVHAYSVQESALPAAVVPSAAVPAAPVVALPLSRGETARAEIRDAARVVLERTGLPDFALIEIVEEMHRRGTDYADTTIRTMVTSHMCINAPGPSAGYPDLERVGRGRYRLL